jgi:hypothetical protein
MMMKEEEYLTVRVQDQINWCDSKSAWNKMWFMRLKVMEIFLALLVPFLLGYVPDGTPGLKFSVGLIGVFVAAIAGITTLYKLQEDWLTYRGVAESLRYEQFLYLTRSGPYKDADTFPAFVERFEGLISKKNTKWTTDLD